jgi:FkbM family methyltransferase
MRPCLTATFSEEINQGKVMLENVLLAQTACNLNYAVQPSAGFGGAASSTSTSGMKVKALCLDELIATLALDRLDFLKMDIEGFEVQALLGASKSLQKFHPYLSITTYHRCADFQMLRHYLRTMGYKHIYASGLCRRPNDNPSDWRPVMIYASA